MIFSDKFIKILFAFYFISHDCFISPGIVPIGVVLSSFPSAESGLYIDYTGKTRLNSDFIDYNR